MSVKGHPLPRRRKAPSAAGSALSVLLPVGALACAVIALAVTLPRAALVIPALVFAHLAWRDSHLRGRPAALMFLAGIALIAVYLLVVRDLAIVAKDVGPWLDQLRS